MANQKKDEANNAKNGCLALIGLSILILLFTVVAILFQCVPLVVPIVFLIMFLVYRYTYRHTDWLHISNGFWLLDSEKEQFIRVGSAIYHAKVNRDSVHAAVQNEGIHINKDGRISAKSYRGQNLRSTLESANATIDEYLPIYEHLGSTPKNRWKAARKHFARYKGAGWAFVVWAAFLVYSVGNPIPGFKQYVSNIGETGKSGVSMVTNLWKSALDSSSDSIAVSSEELPTESREDSEGANVEEDSSNEFAINLWTALFYSLMVYVVLMAAANIVFRVKYKCPPQVDLKNVETYNVHYDPKPKKKVAKDKAKKEKKKENKTDAGSVTIKPIPDPVVKETGETAAREDTPAPQEETFCSKEHEAFHAWAQKFKAEGYDTAGSWENWANSGQWKNLSVKLPLGDTEVRATVEYDTKSKKVYCGIQKADGQEQVSQQLLDSEMFKGIMSETGMSVKNNEWWYCLKFISFTSAYEQLENLIQIIAKSK